ncbi:hypothetical protein CBS101457_000406 [Exobasidium rhododendri]|nr:hypothetical protein CBS101457_000406 [Exobasidium rhododendri]
MVKAVKRNAANTPTVFLIGDSTMSDCRAYPIDSSTAGWGTKLAGWLTIPVVNMAKSGYSARMMEREGYFEEVLQKAQQGDFLVVELGHNDETPENNDPSGKRPCDPSNGISAPCTKMFKGKQETVQTFSKYLEDAALKFKAKGVHVIISSLTSTNTYLTGSFRADTNVFVGYAQEAARLASVDYVGHHEVMTDWWEKLGKEQVLSFYPPQQWTHLTPSGAVYTAAAFVHGLDATQSPLRQYRIKGNPTHYETAKCPK